jgi:hypothetical protein
VDSETAFTDIWNKPFEASKPKKPKAKKAGVKKKLAKKPKAKKAGVKKKLAKKPKAKRPVERTERLDMRITKEQKAKIAKKAAGLRRTVTSVVLEAIERMPAR